MLVSDLSDRTTNPINMPGLVVHVYMPGYKNRTDIRVAFLILFFNRLIEFAGSKLAGTDKTTQVPYLPIQ